MTTVRAASEALAEESERRHPEGPFPQYRLQSWEGAFPGVICGVTEASEDADFGASGTSAWTFLERVESLSSQLGFSAAAWARQVHGVEVRHADDLPDGFTSPGEADGLLTGRAGALLVITVADCVPVYLLAPKRRAMALLHAGWRGASAGILPRGVEALRTDYGCRPSDLQIHFGPAICGRCYEVGRDVLESFGDARGEGGQLDLRDELLGQALELDVPGAQISRSAWCTSCDRDRFHSHRGSQGAAGRMAAFLGWLDPVDGSGGGPAGGQIRLP
jgi:YfiH family protein